MLTELIKEILRDDRIEDRNIDLATKDGRQYIVNKTSNGLLFAQSVMEVLAHNEHHDFHRKAMVYLPVLPDFPNQSTDIIH